jgi:hypothetical protein
MNKLIMLFMGLGLLFLLGCSTSAPSPTVTPSPTETPVPILATSVHEIIGVWQLGSGNHALYFEFNEDGTYRSAQRVVTNLQDSPQQLGQFAFEEGLLTFVTLDESPLCAGQTGTYDVLLLDQGRISLIQREDQCTIRTEKGGLIGLERLSP